ncbi:MAG: hypothetical protein ACJAYO_000697 [Thalassolituus oleivorans]|jgi:hypothetical protein
MSYRNDPEDKHMKDERLARYRNKALVTGGLVGAGLGMIIGATTGMSLEATATGFIGGWLVGELVSYGTTPIEPHHQPKKNN